MSGRDLALAVYADSSGESWQIDQSDPGWAPRLERRHVQLGDPVGFAPLFSDVDARSLDVEHDDAVVYRIPRDRWAPPIRVRKPTRRMPTRLREWLGEVTPRMVAARLAEIRATDPDWPHLEPPWLGKPVDHSRDGEPLRGRAEMVPDAEPEPASPEFAIAHHAFSPQAWSDVELEWEAQGCPQITATRWGVFIANLGDVYPHGVLVPPPLDEAALASARFLTGRQLAWDDETVELVEATIRAKQEASA